MRLEIPEKKKLVYQMDTPIHWGDMDAMGHVNNANYFRYQEIIRVDWLQTIGCPPNPQGQGPVIVNTFCNFYKQVEYPAQLVMKLYVSDPGRSSFETWTTIELASSPGVIYAAGGATIVWIDATAQKSVPMPQWLRAILT